jgi:hypothetical protein
MDPNAQIPTPPPAPQGWAPPPAAPQGQSPVMKIVVAIAGLVLVAGVVIAIGVVAKAMQGPASIVFTTTEPGLGGTCDDIGDVVDSVTAGTEVWMVINFRGTMDDSQVIVTVNKDGEDLGTLTYDDNEGYGCVVEIEPLSDLEPGEYKFTARVGDRIEAEGTLTVK